jgi:hypothetical protein
MLQKIKEMMRVLPAHMAEIVKFNLLTGLRPAEAVESVGLLNDGVSAAGTKYYNLEQQALEHFRFPHVFLRQTKKAFLSYVTLENLRPIRRTERQKNTLG